MLTMDLPDKSSHTHRRFLTVTLRVQVKLQRFLYVLEGGRSWDPRALARWVSQGVQAWTGQGPCRAVSWAQSREIWLGLPSREAEPHPALPKTAVAICFESHKNVPSL